MRRAAVIFILLMGVVYLPDGRHPAQAACPPDCVMGNQDVETSTFGLADKMYGGWYTCVEGGIADSIGAYMDVIVAAAFEVRAAVYGYDTDTSMAFVDSSDEHINLPVGEYLETYVLQNSQTLIPGEKYFICLWSFNAYCRVRYSTSGVDADTTKTKNFPYSTHGWDDILVIEDPTVVKANEVSIFLWYTATEAEEGAPVRRRKIELMRGNQ